MSNHRDKDMNWAGDEEARSPEQLAGEYRGLFEYAQDAILILHPETEMVLDVNQRATDMYGFSKGEFRGLSLRWISTAPERGTERFADTLRAGETFQEERTHVHKEGHRIYVEINARLAVYCEQPAILCIIKDTTARFQSDQAKRRSEEMYTKLFHNLDAAIYLHDLNGKIIEVNQRAIEQTGFSARALKTMFVKDLYHPDQEEIAARAFMELSESESLRVEIDMLKKDGKRYTAEVIASTIKLEDGLLIQAVVRDISEQKRNQALKQALYEIAELGNSQEDSRDFYQSIHGIVARLMYAENFYIALYDKSDDMLRCPYFVDEFDTNLKERKKASGLTEYVIQTKRPLLATRKDILALAFEGKVDLIGKLAVDWVGAPLQRGADVFGVVAVQSYQPGIRYSETDREILTFVGQQMANALDRKRNLDRLAEERQRLLVTMRSIADGVVSTDVDQKIMMMNAAAQTLCGVTLDRARGKTLPELCRIVLDRGREEEVYPLRMAMERNRTVEVNKAILVAGDVNATRRIISLSASPIHDELNSIVGAVLAFRDITAREKMEQEQQKAAKLDSIGILAGGIAHDFNNILTAVIGNISMAKLDARANSVQEQRLTESEKAAHRAKELTQQLLTFSKGGIHERNIISVHQLLADSVDIALLGSNISRNYRIDDQLWPIEANRTQVGQAINNIVLNAVQAMPMGGNLWIDCRNEEVIADRLEEGVQLNSGKYVRIDIRDEGIGIPREILSRIFDPYFTTKQLGSGLGLATTYSIISRHNGCVNVRSARGEGTQFVVYLPASPNAKISERKVEELPVTGEGRILIMDDEEQILGLISQMLAHLGYEAVCVKDSTAAITSFRKAIEDGSRFDAVILDLTIPGGPGGKDVVERLALIDPQIKAIVSSGYSNDPIMGEYQRYGFCACVPKPFSLSELGTALQQALSKETSNLDAGSR